MTDLSREQVSDSVPIKRFAVPPWMTIAGCHFHNYSCNLTSDYCIPVWRMKWHGGHGPLSRFKRRWRDQTSGAA